MKIKKPNTKILLSGTMILASGAIILGATFAFFSDTETSSGNVLGAGAIDLQIDNTSYVTDATGALVSSPNTSWSLTDLTIQKFFNFNDLKPGDIGEDTISLHVNNNDAYLCASARLTEDSDVNYSEPELEDDSTVNQLNPSGTDGELAENVNFVFWADDGDNVYEVGESIFLQGPLSGLGSGGKITLADSQSSVWDGSGNHPVTGAQTRYIGKAWCFGTLTPTPLAQGPNNPITNGTGFSCSGASSANNAAQTDRVTGDLQFYAVQSRNNGSFTCSVGYTPNWPAEENQTVVIDNTDQLADNLSDILADPTSWFIYNDSNDTIDNSLGTFVAGPATPPNGTGSLEFTLTANPGDRRNIATYQFSGTPLASITEMSYGAYSHGGSGGAGVNESPFFNFNVDFNGSDTWQRRLVYVPSANGSVAQDAWNSFDMINGGNAMWTWSGYASNGNKWLDNDPNEYRTWNDIKASFPSIRIRVTDSWLGIRVGEPGPTGYIGNVDFFKIATGGPATTFDFDN